MSAKYHASWMLADAIAESEANIDLGVRLQKLGDHGRSFSHGRKSIQPSLPLNGMVIREYTV
jgi:hypothetical protein